MTKKTLSEEEMLKQERDRPMEEDEEVFKDEVTITGIVSISHLMQKLTPLQEYPWIDKYRPRKPRYFNRVQAGYEWNKYNQTRTCRGSVKTLFRGCSLRSCIVAFHNDNQTTITTIPRRRQFRDISSTSFTLTSLTKLPLHVTSSALIPKIQTCRSFALKQAHLTRFVSN